MYSNNKIITILQNIYQNKIGFHTRFQNIWRSGDTNRTVPCAALSLWYWFYLYWVSFFGLDKPCLKDIEEDIFNLPRLCKELQPRCEILSDILEQSYQRNAMLFVRFIYQQKTDKESSLKSLKILLSVLESIIEWTTENIFQYVVKRQ